MILLYNIQKRFFTKETIRGKIIRLAEIPPLFRDWLR